MTTAVIVQVIIVAGGLITAFLGGVFSRRTRRVTAEVTLSVEARNWAASFEERAKQAELRAERAEQSAAEALRKYYDCVRRTERMERHMDRLERYMRQHGLEPPEMPDE